MSLTKIRIKDEVNSKVIILPVSGANIRSVIAANTSGFTTKPLVYSPGALSYIGNTTYHNICGTGNENWIQDVFGFNKSGQYPFNCGVANGSARLGIWHSGSNSYYCGQTSDCGYGIGVRSSGEQGERNTGTTMSGGGLTTLWVQDESLNTLDNLVSSGLISYYDPGKVLSYTPSNLAINSLVDSQTGTLTNGVTFSSINSASSTSFQGNFVLDGVDDHLAFLDTKLWQSLSTLSFEVWFQVGIKNTRQGILSTHHCTSSSSCSGSNLDAVDFEIQANNSSFVGFRSTNGSFYSASYSIPLQLNTWNHLVGTLDGTTIKYYLNGHLVSSAAWPGGSVAIPTGQKFFLGRYAWHYLKGKIGGFRAYDRALNSSEVLQNYNTEVRRYQY